MVEAYERLKDTLAVFRRNAQTVIDIDHQRSRFAVLCTDIFDSVLRRARQRALFPPGAAGVEEKTDIASKYPERFTQEPNSILLSCLVTNRNTSNACLKYRIKFHLSE
jgi:hypothetical protein